MALPTGLQVDIELTAGAWTNITAYVTGTVSINIGRTDLRGTPQTGTASLRLDNNDGRFTPKNSASAYYPNIVVRKRVRVSYNTGSSPRFTGYIKTIRPVIDNDQHYVELDCVDRLEALSRFRLDSLIPQEINDLAPTLYVPLNADAGVTQASYNGNPTGSIVSYGRASTYELAAPSPVAWDDTKWMAFKPTESVVADDRAESCSRVVLPDPGLSGTSWSVFGAFSAAPLYNQATASFMTQFPVYCGDSGNTVQNFRVELTPGFGPAVYANFVGFSSAASVFDGAAHTFAITSNATTTTYYFDGVSLGTSGATTWKPGYNTLIGTGPLIGTASPWYALSGTFGHFAMWAGTTLTSTQVGIVSDAVRYGFAGELSGARITRIAGYAGLTAGDLNIATGVESCGPLVSSGKSVTDALDYTATAESGGAVAYVDVDGKLRFNDRTQRSTATVTLTLDAEGDLDGSGWETSVDDYGRTDIARVTNDYTGVVTISDQSSGVTMPAVEETTVSVLADLSCARIAEWLVYSGRTDVRLPSVTLDALTGQTAGLYTALASVTIGSIVRVQNLPATITSTTGSTVQVLPASIIDGYVEGWSEEIGVDTYRVTFDLSPWQPRFLLETSYIGRLAETASTMTLTSTITSSATSASVTTVASNPLLSTTAGDYSPTRLHLRIDEEVVAVTAAPGGASPQTITITRGALGTVAQAHTAGAAISVVTGTLVL